MPTPVDDRSTAAITLGQASGESRRRRGAAMRRIIAAMRTLEAIPEAVPDNDVLERAAALLETRDGGDDAA